MAAFTCLKTVQNWTLVEQSGSNVSLLRLHFTHSFKYRPTERTVLYKYTSI